MKRTAAAVVTVVVSIQAAALIPQLGLVTTRGVSMAPRMHSGDLVVVRATPSYGVGDVVAYQSRELDTVVLHRIVGRDGDGYVFQGDNNTWLDPERPTVDDVVGKEWLHIPAGGTWLRRLTSPPALAAYAFLLLAGGGAAAHTRRSRRKERRTMTRHAKPALLGGLPTSLRPVAAGVAVLGLTAATFGALAWTRPLTTTAAADTSQTSTMDFSYTATVPPSPAYDGTTVTAPQPVFRRLTDTVDVTYRYAGSPGTLSVAATLSNATGWSTTVPLAAPTDIPGTHEGSVRLDLSAFEQRAAAAADVTGLPAGGLTVAVVPTVATAGEGEFAPSFGLTLDPLTLKPAEELTAESSTGVAGTREVPATLSALGRDMSVSVARTLALAGLALALLLGAALVGLVRHTGPVAECDRIRHRYGSLLLPVLPVALSSGRPVVDVPDVDALAKLAERYGLLVLHWERSGVDTYVVQDEGTTYRYRSIAAQPLPVPVS